MSANKFEGAAADPDWDEWELPTAANWKPVSRESGEGAMTHKFQLFLGLNSGHNVCKLKYLFHSIHELAESPPLTKPLWKYMHVSGNHCVLLRAVAPEMCLDMTIDPRQDAVDVACTLRGHGPELRWSSTYSPRQDLKVSQIKDEVKCDMITMNKLTKQGTLSLWIGHKKANGNLFLVKNNFQKARESSASSSSKETKASPPCMHGLQLCGNNRTGMY
jgi:hypothetical protein